MNPQQIAYFVERYSQMSDEDLSYLLATRRESLSEEAQHALKTVLKKRDSGAFQDVMAATSADVAVQVTQKQQEAERQAKQERLVNKFFRLSCLAAVVVGLLGALFDGSSFWLYLAGFAVLAFIYLELRLVLRRFVKAMISPH